MRGFELKRSFYNFATFQLRDPDQRGACMALYKLMAAECPDNKQQSGSYSTLLICQHTVYNYTADVTLNQ